jgi:hypothetical protein
VNKPIIEIITEYVNNKSKSSEPRFYLKNVYRHVVDTRLFLLRVNVTEKKFNPKGAAALPAPGSVDRILRKARKKGLVNYDVINRNQSFYLALPIGVTTNG